MRLSNAPTAYPARFLEVWLRLEPNLSAFKKMQAALTLQRLRTVPSSPNPDQIDLTGSSTRRLWLNINLFVVIHTNLLPKSINPLTFEGFRHKMSARS